MTPVADITDRGALTAESVRFAALSDGIKGSEKEKTRTRPTLVTRMRLYLGFAHWEKVLERREGCPAAIPHESTGRGRETAADNVVPLDKDEAAA